MHIKHSTQSAGGCSRAVFLRSSVLFCVLRSLLYVGKKVIKRNAEKIDKKNDITRFGLVDVTFPTINRFLAHADLFCERRLRNFFLQPQFFYFITDFHKYNFSRILLANLDKEECFLYNIDALYFLTQRRML